MEADICHVNLALGYRGGERQTELLIRELATRDWKQQAVLRKHGELVARMNDLKSLQVFEKPASVIMASMFTGQQRLIHIHHGRSLKVGWLRNLALRTPYIVTRRVDNRIRNTRLNRALYRNAAAVVVLTDAIANAVNAIAPEVECLKIPSVSGGLPQQAEVSARIRAESGKSFLVGNVGALDDSHKGQLQLLDVARKASKEHPDMGFFFVGSGRDEHMLKEAAADLDNVFFSGYVDNVGDYMGAFDVFAFPSRREGLGSTLLDAYAFGLPVVATRAGGIPEIVTDGDNGMLVDVDDTAALYAAINKLRADDKLRTTVSRNNLAKAELYTPAGMAEQYEHIYRTILD